MPRRGRENYFETYSFAETWAARRQADDNAFWHRPPHAMLDALTSAGFHIASLNEPQPGPEARSRFPEAYLGGESMSAAIGRLKHHDCVIAGFCDSLRSGNDARGPRAGHADQQLDLPHILLTRHGRSPAARDRRQFGAIGWVESSAWYQRPVTMSHLDFPGVYVLAPCMCMLVGIDEE